MIFRGIQPPPLLKRQHEQTPVYALDKQMLPIIIPSSETVELDLDKLGLYSEYLSDPPPPPPLPSSTLLDLSFSSTRPISSKFRDTSRIRGLKLLKYIYKLKSD